MFPICEEILNNIVCEEQQEFFNIRTDFNETTKGNFEMVQTITLFYPQPTKSFIGNSIYDGDYHRRVETFNLLLSVIRRLCIKLRQIPELYNYSEEAIDRSENLEIKIYTKI